MTQGMELFMSYFHFSKNHLQRSLHEYSWCALYYSLLKVGGKNQFHAHHNRKCSINQRRGSDGTDYFLFICHSDFMQSTSNQSKETLKILDIYTA